MKLVCLQFENNVALTDFLAVIENINCEINHRQLTIICHVSDDELALALKSFGAKVITNQPEKG